MTVEDVILDVISRDERLNHVSERESYLGITPTDKRSMVYGAVECGLIRFLNWYTEEKIESDWETTLCLYL